MKQKFLLFLLFALPAFAFGQVLKTAAVPYTKGASPFTPNTASSSEIRVDTSCSCMYWWDRDNLTWMRVRTGPDVISGSAAPAYTPRDNQSLFAVNADGELYYYNVSTWVQIGGSGGGGIYGGSGNVPDATVATLVDDFEIAGPDISSVTITTGTSIGGQYFQNFSGATVSHRDTSGSSSLQFSGSGALFSFADGSTDRLTIGGRDARYSGDYSATYSARSLIDKGYADGAYLGASGVSGSADEVAVFSGSNTLTSYPELAFDGTVLELQGDLNIEKSTPTLSVVDNGASSSGGGGLLVLSANDNAALASGDLVGTVQFTGSTGPGGTSAGASIEAVADGAWSGTTSRSALKFKTAATGSTTPTERLRITRAGEVGLRNGANLDFYGPTDVQAFEWDATDSILYVFGYNAGAEVSLQTKLGIVIGGSIGLTGNVNNVYLGCDGGILEIGSTGAYSISGMQASMGTGKSRLLFIHNVSAFDITLLNESASSSAVNRFAIGTDYVLAADEMLGIIYDQNAERWIIFNRPGTGGGSYTDEQAQDAVGSILTDGTTIDFTYNDATPSITAEVKSNVIQAGGNTTGAAVAIGTNDNNALSLEVNNVERIVLNTDYSVTATASVANTNTAFDHFLIRNNSTGTAAAGFGTGLAFYGESSTTDNRFMGSFATTWTTATDASRTSNFGIYIVNNGSAAQGFTVVGNANPYGTFGSGTTQFANAGITAGATFTVGGSSSTVNVGGSSGLVSLTSSSTSAGAISLAATSNTSTSTGGITFGQGTNVTQTSGTRNYLLQNTGFAPTSGTAVHNSMAFTGTFNQTGGANGITRGIYLNQTLTAVADFRGLEIAYSNSSAKGIYQSGSSTTNNFVGGTMFGSTSAPASVAAIEISSTTKGLLLPRMTTTQRDAITAVAGLLIFNTTTTKMECYDGATWQAAW
jgi:hypothetical protein